MSVVVHIGLAIEGYFFFIIVLDLLTLSHLVLKDKNKKSTLLMRRVRQKGQAVHNGIWVNLQLNHSNAAY